MSNDKKNRSWSPLIPHDLLLFCVRQKTFFCDALREVFPWQRVVCVSAWDWCKSFMAQFLCVFISSFFVLFLFFDSLFYFSVVCVSLSFSLPYFLVLAIFYSQFLILLILHSMEYVHPIHGAYPWWLSG